MKLCHVTMHFFPAVGGQEVYLQALNKLLMDSGVTVSVIQPSRVASKFKPECVQYVPALRFLGRYFPGIDWFWFNLMLNLKRGVLKNQDVIVSHYPFHYPALNEYKNIVVVSHGLDWKEPPESFFDRYKKRSAFLARKNGVKIVANDTNFLRALGVVINPGERPFERVNEKMWFIPNCVDGDIFRDLNLQRNNVILVPRNIRASRGIHLAIGAFELFSKKNDKFVMEIVGGPLHGKYFDYCMNLVRKYSLEDKVRFIGSLPNNALLEVYNGAKITLIPTIAFEGTSLSALESMACGTPVVSTKVGGLADLPSYKVMPTVEGIADGLAYVLSSWDDEAKRQRSNTINTFNMHNWKNAWLDVIAG